MAKIKLDQVKKIFIELLIVFIGVFLAFQLNNYKEGIQDAKLRKKLYHLMLKDFEANLFEVSEVRKQIETFKTDFNTAIENGEQPSVRMIIPDLSNNLLLLRSVFNSGHLENLDPQYVSNISRGSNFITRASNYIHMYNESIIHTLRENDYNNDNFFNAENQLKEEYQWILSELDNVLAYVIRLEGAIKNGAIPSTQAWIDGKNPTGGE